MRVPRFRLSAVSLLLAFVVTGCERHIESPMGLEAAFDTQRFRISVSKQRIDIFDRQYDEVVFSAHANEWISAHRIDPTGSLPPAQPAIVKTCSLARLDRADPYKDHFLVSGHFESAGCDATFQIRISVEGETVVLTTKTSDISFNRLSIGFDTNSKEYLFGFGAQPTVLDFKGRQVPIWSQLQGNGRGGQPITDVVESHWQGTAGTPYSTPYSVPLLHSTRGYSLLLDNPEYTLFDFRRDQSNYLHVHHHTVKLKLWSCRPMADCLRQISTTDRMQSLPAWVHQGVVVELFGSTEQMKNQLAQLESAAVPIAGVWMNSDLMPADTYSTETPCACDTEQFTLIEQLRQKGIRLLAHADSLLSPQSLDPSDLLHGRLQEVQQKGLLVAHEESQTAPLSLVNLTDPKARQWLIETLPEAIRTVQASGWLAEMSAYPDLTGDQAIKAMSSHNRIPLFWAQVNGTVSRKLEDSVFITDTGTRGSAKHTGLFRVSQQVAGWDKYDGLQSALIALINGGLSGQTIAFADTGGNTTFAFNKGAYRHHRFSRGENLLKRWIEVSAFLPVFSARAGNTPDLNAQVFDKNVIEHFAFFSRLFVALQAYREELMTDAETLGMPLIRHPFLMFPDRKQFLKMEPETLQFMLGDSIMVAPILTPPNEKNSREIYLPAGHWMDLWTGEQISNGSEGKWIQRSVAQGRPPVFLYRNPRSERLLIPQLMALGLVHLEDWSKTSTND